MERQEKTLEENNSRTNFIRTNNEEDELNYLAEILVEAFITSKKHEHK